MESGALVAGMIASQPNRSSFEASFHPYSPLPQLHVRSSSLLTMAKGSAKSSRVTAAATPLSSLKQARLIGINDHVKSVRQKSTTPNLNSAPGGLKQVGLAAFGFSDTSKTPDRRDAIETPPSKRRKPTADLEVPETQFAQNTQSPEFCDYDPFATGSRAVFGEREEYSSPLSSPPLMVSSLVSLPSISPPIAMPPPPPPVTPKRRRITEVPDSKSPPVTPFTPYMNQQRDNWLGSQSSPTARKSISPVVPRMEEDLGVSDSPTPTPSQMLPQRLFTSSPGRVQQHDKDGEEQALEKREKVAKKVQVVPGDRDRIIKSSQWWENEDTQNFPLSTQNTEGEVYQNTTAPGDIGHDTAPQESGVRLARGEESFRVDLSYKSDPSTETTYGGDEAHEPQGGSGMGQEDDIQELFRSMAHPVPEFHGDTLEPETTMGDDPIILMGENFPSSTASQGDPEDVDEGNKSQEYPAYGAYRTQQFPSSFYQHNNYRLSSPELLPSSQFVRAIDSQSGFAKKDDNRDQGVMEGGFNAGDEGYDNYDKEGFSQLPPRTINESDTAAMRDDSQFLPALLNGLDTLAKGERGDHSHEEWQDVGIDEDNDSKGRGRVGGRDRAVTRSQLLPSELMETFPMPPPLSQFSSYGPYGYEYDESETQ